MPTEEKPHLDKTKQKLKFFCLLSSIIRLFKNICLPLLAVLISTNFILNCYKLSNLKLNNTELFIELLRFDTDSYLKIAGDFSNNDFSFSYNMVEAHRQPLFPLFLSIIMKVFGKTAFNYFLFLNIFFSFAAIAFAVISVWKLYSKNTAAIIAIFLCSNYYLVRYTTSLLSEPLYFLLNFLTAYCVFDFIRKENIRSVYLITFLCSLCYLTRTNGLFSYFVIEIYLFYFCIKNKINTKHAFFSLILFILLTSASWLPRLIYWGNPLYHGYISNYLWSDNYNEVWHSLSIFSYKTYFSKASFDLVIVRILKGIIKTINLIYQKFPSLLIPLFVSIFGIHFMDSKTRKFLIIGIIQLFPTIWVMVSYPGERVIVFSILPFIAYASSELIFNFMLMFSKLLSQRKLASINS